MSGCEVYKNRYRESLELQYENIINRLIPLVGELGVVVVLVEYFQSPEQSNVASMTMEFVAFANSYFNVGVKPDVV